MEGAGLAEDRRLFGITGDWSTAALDSGFFIPQYVKGAVG